MEKGENNDVEEEEGGGGNGIGKETNPEKLQKILSQLEIGR
jgi:hypothetical protein